MVSTEYDNDWLYCVLITFIFIAVNAPQNVYPKLQRLQDFKDPAKVTQVETESQEEEVTSEEESTTKVQKEDLKLTR